MKCFIDQMGREVMLPSEPKRIVSLVPSQTELLAHFGLADRVVGITKFCIHPKVWHQEKAKVGGTKKINRERLLALDPDFCIGNKEENSKEDIEWLSERIPTWMSDIHSVEDALDMIHGMGEILDCSKKATALDQEIREGFASLSELGKGRSVVYYVWHKPDFVVGKNTYIHDVLTRLGLRNLVSADRYPEANEGITQPDLVFLSSEPYPFSEMHVQQWKTKFPGANVILVDGEMFSWYGSRMLHAPGYIHSLFEKIGGE